MTKHEIRKAILRLRKEHKPSPQRDHTEGLLTAALQCVEALERA